MNQEKIFKLETKSYQSRYQNILLLGSGSFGTVYLAKSKSMFSQRVINNDITEDNNINNINSKIIGTLMEPLIDSTLHSNAVVAVKVMNKKLENVKDYTRVKEVKFILLVPLHPCLVQIYDMFVSVESLQLTIIMEEMNQNLYQLMRSRKDQNFLPTTLRSILRQLADGIRHIHKHGFFHRDIKPENILIMLTTHYYGGFNKVPAFRKDDNYVLKIADYGLARYCQNTNPYTSYISTRWYRLPEILLRRKFYLKPVDIWAFATVAVEVATFRPLFPGSNELDQTWKILSVLGSPNIHDSENDVLPFGGLWLEAEILANRLGFSLPKTAGLLVADVVPKELHHAKELSEIIQRCLTWNPESRATIGWVCSRPYFKDKLKLQPSDDQVHISVPSLDKEHNEDCVSTMIGTPSKQKIDNNRKQIKGYPQYNSPFKFSNQNQSNINFEPKKFINPASLAQQDLLGDNILLGEYADGYEGIFNNEFNLDDIEGLYSLNNHGYCYDELNEKLNIIDELDEEDDEDDDYNDDDIKEDEDHDKDLVYKSDFLHKKQNESRELALFTCGDKVFINYEKCISSSNSPQVAVQEENESQDASFTSLKKIVC